ncbi:peptide/nickel transport system permease protein [Lipingzhangella halophila]|uniref:Peptide/nickel transport system permease protein n=1 Tax=Lipingzhangella halophila TaxID=1783352 RepID=A0A7W7RJR5_9ACTN|nr:ABC transporter permease [Lipingzhangella halophila]MBB4932888.1 peptide/nickel transport system permease protein [Lipingzhangella halophila]
MTAVAEVPAAPETERSRPSPRPHRGRLAYRLALGWIVLLAVLAATAGLIAPFDPTAPAGPARLAPFSDAGHLLGTDSIGRDVLSRLLYGIRISVAVGVGATLIAVTAGVLVGLLAAYYRGWVAAAVNVGTDTVLSFPPLLVLLALAAVLNPGVPALILSLGLLFTPPFARLTRSAALSQMELDYIAAARSLGAGAGRIIFFELLPNSIRPVISYSVVVVALVIVIEGSLSFLGVGIPPPAPSWGSMIASAKDHIALAPYLMAPPALMLVLTVLAFNTAGDHLRNRFSGSAQ